MKLQKLFNQTDLYLRDHIVFYKKTVVGVLIPGVIFGQSLKGDIYVHGVNGTLKLLIDSIENTYLSLVASGSILSGNILSCEKVNVLLNKATSSRTMSYITCIATNCNHAIEILDNISNKKITFLGSGGIGSLCALILAGIGIKNLEIIDHDIIEKSNLNRQILWSLKDIGKYKVDILKKRILDRFPNINVIVHKIEISRETIEPLVKNTDIVLFTADNPIGMVKYTSKYSKEYGFKLISAGYLLRKAGIEIWNEKEQKITWNRSPNPIIPSFGPTNIELAGMASSIIFHLLAGFIKKDIDALHSWETSKYPREFLNRINISDII